MIFALVRVKKGNKIPDITISITDTEKEALDYKMTDISAWTDEAVTTRAKIAKDEIISLLVAHCNANEISRRR